MSRKLGLEGHALMPIGQRADPVLVQSVLDRHHTHYLEATRRLEPNVSPDQFDSLPEFELMEDRHVLLSARRDNSALYQ
jgi:hypothetical protein